MRRECVVGLIKREKKIAAKMSAVLFWAVVLDDVFVDRQRRQRFILKPHGALVCLLFSACSLHLNVERRAKPQPYFLCLSCLDRQLLLPAARLAPS